MREKLRWADLTPNQKTAVLVGVVAEVALTAAALYDLGRRPSSGVRGSKVLWASAFVVQPFGPLAYLAFGRALPGAVRR